MKTKVQVQQAGHRLYLCLRNLEALDFGNFLLNVEEQSPFMAFLEGRIASLPLNSRTLRVNQKKTAECVLFYAGAYRC